MMHGVYELSADKECFSPEEVQQALTKMHNGKACDSSGIYAEMLKWLPEEGLAYVTDMHTDIISPLTGKIIASRHYTKEGTEMS